MQLPHGPQAPAIVQMLQWILNPISVMEANAKRYGDIFTIKLSRPVVFVSNPQLLQQILTSDTKELEAPGDLSPAFKSLFGANSVMVVSGEAHRRQRQWLMPPFHGDRMRVYGDTISQVTEDVISKWQTNKPFDIRLAMQAITLRVIMQAVFGMYEGARAQELEQLLSDILEEGAKSPLRVIMLLFPIFQKDLGPKSPWGKFLRRRQRVYELFSEEIQQRREHPDPSRVDILSFLMQARDEVGQSMTTEELCDELMSLLVAGHETTATSLAWALYWIHKSPAIKQKLLQEFETLADHFNHHTILKLPYLNAVCCETLRIYPVAILTFPRIVKSLISFSKYQFEPGTIVYGCIYLTHRREELYSQSQLFKPERFLERQFSPYEFLPFGGGARRCIGMAFAQFEIKVVLATILSRVELALMNTQEVVKPKRRGIVTGPDRPIMMFVKSRL